MVDLRSSYEHCRRMARRAASNFYHAFQLLPGEKRRAMHALYAFLRRTDDLADSDTAIDARRERLARWRAALLRALGWGHAAPGAWTSVPGAWTSAASELTAAAGTSNLSADGSDSAAGVEEDPLFPALADTVATYRIPAEHLCAVVDGVEMDLDRTRYEQFEHLAEYCHRVASAVGLACLHIWGFRGGARVNEPARQCGLAFQLTNILRDLKEDAERDRIYLPLEELRRFGYTVDELKAGVRDERLEGLLRFQIERAKSFYRGAAELDALLLPDGRRIFGAMTATYRQLLDRIERVGGGVLERRVRLGRWGKLRIALRWGWMPLASSPSPVT